MAKPKSELAEVSGMESPEFRRYQFRLRGHGQDLWVGEFEETSEERAFRQAFKACKRFELPGWSLTCVTTGTTLPLVKLMGYKNDSTLTPYDAKRGRRTSRRI